MFYIEKSINMPRQKIHPRKKANKTVIFFKKQKLFK